MKPETTDLKFWSGKKVIVTGGAGFIGSTLVKLLVSSGAKVTVIDNLWRGSLDNLKDESGSHVIDIDADFHLADLTDSGKAMEFIRNADYVYHLADVVAGVNFVFSNEMYVFRQNILINTNALAACIANGIKNYIYVGTACSYPKALQMADGYQVLKEEQTYPAEPESSYGWSKLMGEYEAELVLKTGKMNVGLLRFHNVYGPGSVYDTKKSQVLPALARKAANYPKEEFVVWGSGEQYRDFVYIDDVVNALNLVAQKGMNKGLIQIGSEEPTTIRDAAETVAEISGKNIDIRFDTQALQGDRGRVAECSRARDILGWKKQYTFRQGMEKLYKWVESDIEKKEMMLADVKDRD